MPVRTIKIKLSPDAAQSAEILETFQAFNACCNWISEIAFRDRLFTQVDLHNATYYAAREKFGLSAQLAIRAIGKVLESYKLDRLVRRTFSDYSAVVYDQRIFRLIGVTYASMTLLHSRQKIRLECGSYQRRHLAGKPAIGQVDLLYNRGMFTLALSIRRPDPPKIETDGFLGVDLGIVNIATDSHGNQYSGEAVKAHRRHHRELRRSLGRCNTKGSKRRLKSIGKRENRFVRHTNHVISKQIVQTALNAGKAIALEVLTGIRNRADGYSREFRWQLGSWAFFQLGCFIRYKAEDAGLPVESVDPRDTSRTCSRCGYCDKANRKSQSKFLCLECGFVCNADENAGRNIGARAARNTAYTHPQLAAAN